MPSILIDMTHGERVNPEFTGDTGLSLFKGALEEIDYVVGKIVKRSNFNIDHFKETDVLFIAFPTERFNEKEIENILDFLELGGSLLLAAEWGNIKNNAEYLNDISRNFGITFNQDRIADSEKAFEEEIKLFGEVIGKERAAHFPRITEFAEHPITEDIAEIGHFSGCSINAHDDLALAWSSPSSFGDVDADAELDPGEEVGHLITAAHPTFSSGRIVTIGDTSIFTNKYIHLSDSKRFLVNIVRWLAKDLK
jgi:hypothetical protein